MIYSLVQHNGLACRVLQQSWTVQVYTCEIVTEGAGGGPMDPV